MATTIIGPQLEPFPSVAIPSIIELSETWGGQWMIHPELELLQCTLACAGHEISSLQFLRRYGWVKQPWEDAPVLRSPLGPLLGWWVRLRMVGQAGLQTVWTGRIMGRSIDAGVAEQWQAYGPEIMLRRHGITSSWWLVGADVTEIGWLPNLNDRDGRKWLQGNRTQAKVAGDTRQTYLYGGTSTWTHYDFLEYLCDVIDTRTEGGPAWTMGGQLEPLKSLKETLRFGESETATSILDKLIPKRMGLDWLVVPTDAGFEIRVYSLTSETISYLGYSLPANPNVVEVQAASTTDAIRIHTAESEDHGYSRVRIVGKRIVVCCTLRGDGAVPSLVANWPAALEAEYKTGDTRRGVIWADAAAHDEFRRKEKFRSVYQDYRVPSLWDFNAGQAAPALDGEGNLLQNPPAEYQYQVRRTLSWIPLREGYDYSNGQEVNLTPTVEEPEFRKPYVLIGHADIANFFGGTTAYTPAEEQEMSVSTDQFALGIHVNANPNHVLAKNHWPEINVWIDGCGTASSEYPADYDYTKLVATVAFESDQRLVLEATTPAGFRETDGTLDVEMPDAECWILCANTVVGLDASKHLQTSGEVHRLLRTDRDHMAQVMAGTIARYLVSRARADIVLVGYRPWGSLLGQIMTVIEGGGTVQRINSPITSITWTGGPQPHTTIKAGFAM